MPYTEVDISAISPRHPVWAFNAYWTQQARATGVPCRQQINPAEIAGILSWLLVLEAMSQRTGTEYRYRLAGTGCTELFGVDYTGKTLGENLTPEGADIRRLEFSRVLVTYRPIFSTTHLPIKKREFITVHRGVFPVSSSGAEVDQIFVVIAPTATECIARSTLAA